MEPGTVETIPGGGSDAGRSVALEDFELFTQGDIFCESMLECIHAARYYVSLLEVTVNLTRTVQISTSQLGCKSLIVGRGRSCAQV